MSPITREEQYLAYIAGESNSYPSQPITREEVYLDKIAKSGVSGGSGVNVQSLSVTENGTYTAPSGVAYSPVFVDVQQGGNSGESVNKLVQVINKTVTEITAEDLDGATNMPSNFFKECKALTSIIIPDSVTEIGAQAFYSCEKIKNIIIPNGVTKISGNTFYWCKSLNSVTIPEGVTVIDYSAFTGCINLPSIILPSTVTTIGDRAFYECRVLKSVTIKAETPPTIQSSTFNSVPADCAFSVPALALEAYKSATNWSARADYIFAIEE